MLNGQIGWLYPAEYFVGVYCPLPELVHCIEATGEQPAFPRKKGEWIDRRQTMARRQRDNEGAVWKGHNVRRHDKPGIGLTGHRCEGAFNLDAIMHIETNQIQFGRSSRRFGRLQVTEVGRLWMHDEADILHVRRNLAQLLEPFPAHCRLEIGKSGYIAARSG